VAIVLGAGMALAIGSLIGAWWFEPRPFVVDHFTPLVQHIADAGFPSDHLLLLGAVIGACWMAARRLAVAVGVLGLLVGTARVYVGVHWPEDVVAGFVIGVAAGAGVWALLVPVIPLEGEVVGQPGPVAGFLHARERPGVRPRRSYSAIASRSRLRNPREATHSQSRSCPRSSRIGAPW
jgi:undecaprenyl-diphosphatase